MIGKRYVDKLMKVSFKTGESRWLLLHIEVQSQQEKQFSARLFEYYYRIYDRYRKPILTLAILSDDSLSWHPKDYEIRVEDIEVLRFTFLSNKLLDYRHDEKKLLETMNPFGTVVYAYLKALQTQGNIEERFIEKFKLARLLYEKGLTKEKILSLYKFIDWVMVLPTTLEIRYTKAVWALKEEQTMGYITTIERMGMQRGYEEAERAILNRLLQHKFQHIPAHYQEKLSQMDISVVSTLITRVMEVSSVEEIFEENC